MMLADSKEAMKYQEASLPSELSKVRPGLSSLELSWFEKQDGTALRLSNGLACCPPLTLKNFDASKISIMKH